MRETQRTGRKRETERQKNVCHWPRPRSGLLRGFERGEQRYAPSPLTDVRGKPLFPLSINREKRGETLRPVGHCYLLNRDRTVVHFSDAGDGFSIFYITKRGLIAVAQARE